MTLHVPAEQVGVSLLVLHALPQPPQLCGSLLIDVSQLLPGCPGQCAYPVLQAPAAQLPWTQVGVPFWVLQMSPHVPQLTGSDCTLSSQPSAAFLLQSM